MNSKIAELMPFVDFLGAALGSSTEIVLHDLTESDGAIVKIVNGHVSGREVGAPATEFARTIVREYEDTDLSFVTDYVCTTVDGRPLQGSTFLVRDEGKIVGLVCVNIDPQPFRTLEDALKVFMEAYRHGGSEEYRDAHLDEVRAAYRSSSVETLSLGGRDTGVRKQLQAMLAAMGKTPSDLDQDRRIGLIRKLDAAGAFLVKGAAAEVAEELHVSVPTVYRYLQKVRREASGSQA